MSRRTFLRQSTAAFSAVAGSAMGRGEQPGSGLKKIISEEKA